MADNNTDSSLLTGTDITTVSFSGELRRHEVQMFRGAFVRAMGGNDSPTLLHNHGDGGLRVAYPLVQYKSVGGHPCVVGIGNGCALLDCLPDSMTMMLGRHRRTFSIDSKSTVHYVPAVDNSPKMYRLTNYLPLNTSNINDYKRLPALTDRVCFLENVITANILSFFKGIGCHCDERIQTAISSIERHEDIRYKGVMFHSFDLTFICNVVLPSNIGLGKSPSVGFGMLRRIDIPPQFFSVLKQQTAPEGLTH